MIKAYKRFDELFIEKLVEASKLSSTGIIYVYDGNTGTYQNIDSIYVDDEGDIIFALYMDFEECDE